jgi:tripartite-type tricarboxylate transporter receptor subunit TctC
MKRLSWISMVCFIAVISFICVYQAQAADYPIRPITAIIPVEAGGDADITARPVLEKVSKNLGKPVIVVNKPGAGLTIGYGEIYRAKPDGYTIGVAVASIITVKMQGFFPYDYHDFTILGHYWSMSPIIVASKKISDQFRTVQELFAYVKAHPEEVKLATTAVGGAYWNAAMLLQESSDMKFNIIPQQGSAGYVVKQVAGGHIEVGVSGFSAAKPQIDAGNIVPLAVIGPNRLPGKYSNLPTVKELGYDASIRTFGLLMGPPKMPNDIVTKLVKSIEIAAKDKEYQTFIKNRYDEPMYLSPQEFVKIADEESKVYYKVFEKTGLLKKK